jgi:hypothetical protein
VHDELKPGPPTWRRAPGKQAPITLIADPHKISRTELSLPVPPGPSSRWMIDGKAGDTRVRNGNSSITTRVGSAVYCRNR